MGSTWKGARATHGAIVKTVTSFFPAHRTCARARLDLMRGSLCWDNRHQDANRKRPLGTRHAVWRDGNKGHYGIWNCPSRSFQFHMGVVCFVVDYHFHPRFYYTGWQLSASFFPSLIPATLVRLFFLLWHSMVDRMTHQPPEVNKLHSLTVAKQRYVQRPSSVPKIRSGRYVGRFVCRSRDIRY